MVDFGSSSLISFFTRFRHLTEVALVELERSESDLRQSFCRDRSILMTNLLRFSYCLPAFLLGWKQCPDTMENLAA